MYHNGPLKNWFKKGALVRLQNEFFIIGGSIIELAVGITF